MSPPPPDDAPEREGVIRFDTAGIRSGPAPTAQQLGGLLEWRARLHRSGLVGIGADGIGYGNVSRRVAIEGFGAAFVITGSGTGGLARLTAEQCCVVEACDPVAGTVRGVGPVLPSSESMTHHAIYQASRQVGAVFHVHSAAIWHGMLVAGMAATPADVDYGTPRMAAEARLAMGRTLAGVFAMRGHRDGVVAWGPDPALTGEALLALHRRFA